MQRLLPLLPLAALLAACSPDHPQPDNAPPQPKSARAVLGSPQWYAWVDSSLQISDNGHGPDPGSTEWNNAVQRELGQEAPQSQPGSPEWQQSVDSLLRTRAPLAP
ncbi:hypothetical protein [Dyella sp.]|uniref:hypothetical protein n=1 Tax=Dyella sp. TaxID=1869338 RepID=UPI002ED38306